MGSEPFIKILNSSHSLLSIAEINYAVLLICKKQCYFYSGFYCSLGSLWFLTLILSFWRIDIKIMLFCNYSEIVVPFIVSLVVSHKVAYSIVKFHKVLTEPLCSILSIT